MKRLTCWVICVLWIVTSARPTSAGSILREVWEGIGGNAVSDLTSSPAYPDHPTSTNYVTDFFEAPTDAMESYGQRMHGFITPPLTGNYTFWIATDDGGELWLSTDSDPAKKALIASVQGWTPSRGWNVEANQQSAPIPLKAGQIYYIAALQKEGGGGDNLAVRWLRPDAVYEGPIPASYLLPYGTAFEAPTIAQQPTNTTVVEGGTAVFTVVLSNVTLASYQWLKDGAKLAGATQATLNFSPVALADNGARFSVTITNRLGATNSSSAILTVTPDLVAPVLVEVRNLGSAKVRVRFSEPVDSASATLSANYKLDKGVSVLAGAFEADTQTIVLTTSQMVYGTQYTLTVSNVKDRAQAGNLIIPGSQMTFTAYEYVPTDVGNPTMAGSTVVVPGGFDVTGGGKTIGGTNDQFQFAWQEKTGDFDFQTRLESLSVSDPYVRAGLMARDSLNGNARYGAVFASSPQLGCFWSVRPTTGATATHQFPVKGYPVNSPYTWLRLQRTGTTLVGYASMDAATWVELGRNSYGTLPAKLFFGLAVGSDTTNRTATAEFRDLMLTQSKTTGTYAVNREPLAPSSRATGLIFSEIMYHPAPRTDGKNLQFVEIYNARSTEENLTGYRLTGDIEYRFPDGFKLQAGAFALVAAAPEDLKAVYRVHEVLGPFTNSLPNGSGQLQLRNNADAIRLDVTYQDSDPWPVSADGGGHSLVLARPSYGEGQPEAWAASQRIGGSPGGLDPIVPNPQLGVVLNEFLAHTDPPQMDYIELFNRSKTSVDLSGCVLTDDITTNRYRFPAGTTLEGRGFLLLTQETLGFRLDATGERIFLINSNATQVLDAIRFGAQENGVASGLVPDGEPGIRRLAELTPGKANAARRQERVVINEIMYDPISLDSDDEFLELHNPGADSVNLSGWSFENGIQYTFPTNTVLPPGGYLVVAHDVQRLRTNYTQLNAANSIGNYEGSLRNGGERVSLAMPDTIVSTNSLGEVKTNLVAIVVAEVLYKTGGRWGQWANAGGSSLELVDPRADPLLPSSWADSDETLKAPWTEVSYNGKMDNGSGSANRLRIGMLGAGECLVDDVEFFKDGGTNMVQNNGFEAGVTSWSFFGNHSRSTVDSVGAGSGSKCLHVRGLGDCDTGINSIRTPFKTTVATTGNATIRAKVRWLKGWPEVLFRLQGNYLEFPARLTVPTNLGTPGLANTRRVSNAGPAITDVKHSPLLPQSGEAVLVTCRISDPDSVGAARVRYRVDPSTTLSTVTLRDDGLAGDDTAGDGVYSARIPAQSAGALVAFRVEASDAASSAGSSLFPANAPAQECLVRWSETMPTGTLPHYHLWNTQATESARNASGGLDNTYRDATLVYGNYRVIYNAGFRDKGSPFHGGTGDYAVTVPSDDLLLGTEDRIYAQTGNGGTEGTNIRSQLAAWLGQQMGIPYLHAQYVQFFRNGWQPAPVMEDLEQPARPYAKRWFPNGGDGDLYKVAVWFEFQDDNYNFSTTLATLQKFTTTGGAYKLARYRWNWQRRVADGMASNYTNLLDLVTAANDTSANYVDRLGSLADIDQWMRAWAFDYAMGNWDVWTYNVGQNMYIYKQEDGRWVLMPWDIDFTFGLGDGSSGALTGGQDPTMSRVFSTPAFKRMMWRAYQDVVNGPYLKTNYQPQIDMRRAILEKNQIGIWDNPASITSYIEARRTYLKNQITSADAKDFSLTTNGGLDFESSTGVVTLEGTAPFAAATIEVNGVAYPVTWTSVKAFKLNVALSQATNVFVITGRDRLGRVVAGTSPKITVTYSGPILEPERFIALNEVQYNPLSPNASYIELYNRSTTQPFDLSGLALEGVGYTFPPGSILNPDSYLVLAKDRTAFAAAYGPTIRVFDQYPGSLDNDGEHLALVRPGTNAEPDSIVSDLRYSNLLPWPVDANGTGAALQLLDPSQDSYRVANWTASTNQGQLVSPGSANALRQALEPFPTLWLNELVTENPGAIRDSAGEADAWVEIYNSGTDAWDLSSLYLTDDYLSLAKWQFPVGTVLQPGKFLLVWLDGQPGQTLSGELHASFAAAGTNGSIALVRIQGNPSTAAVLDYIDYSRIPSGRSFGSFPDGQPRGRRVFPFPTPRAANNPNWPQVPVVINEFMASNNRTILDPANSRYEDWFELYNAGTVIADLSGYHLTDTLTNWNKFTIPDGTVLHPGEFLLVWADELSSANVPGSDLHVNFKLSGSGEEIGLFDPVGLKQDGWAFGAQTNDVSMGRFPDGGSLPLLVLDQPTPRTPNYMAGGNKPPVFATTPPQSVAELSQLQFTVKATDPEGLTVSYQLSAAAPKGTVIDPVTGKVTWTPTEDQGPGVHQITVLAMDAGSPPRTTPGSVEVTVTEVNQAPTLSAIPAQTLPEGTTWTYTIHATDPDIPANSLRFALEPGAPEGMSIDLTTGVLSWDPTEAQGPGTYQATVVVTDNGSPAMSDRRLVQFEVQEVNSPPVWSDISPQTIQEGEFFRLRVDATDPDGVGTVLRYSLDQAPAGARIDENTGWITWQTGENDGPTNAIFTVRVTEMVVPRLSAARTFGVQVQEVNQAPWLHPITAQQIEAGDLLQLQATATDTDVPSQRLSYALVSGPAGLSVATDSGLIQWQSDAGSPASTNTVVIRVTDDGPGTLSNTQQFQIVVVPVPNLVISEILLQPAKPGAEFIEIANPSKVVVDLSGVKLLGDSLSYSFAPNTKLAAGAYLVVVKNLAAFSSVYTNSMQIAGAFSGTLSPEGGLLRLVRTAPIGDLELDVVRYEGQAPWPVTAIGASLQVVDLRQDNLRPANWGSVTGVVDSGPRQLVAMTNVWKFNQSGDALPASWISSGFDDSSWPGGAALLYNETAALPAPANTPLTLGPITFYFRSHFQYAGSPVGQSLRLTTVLDDGMVLYLNGKQLYRLGIDPDVIVDNATLANRTVGDAAQEGPFELSAEGLNTGDNLLAAEVHQNSSGSSDLVFGLLLEVQGTAAPSTPGGPNSIAGTLPEFPEIWLNEISMSTIPGASGDQLNPHPWVEIHNGGTVAVPMEGWYLGNSSTNLEAWPFPAGSEILPGEFYLVHLDGKTNLNSGREFHTSFQASTSGGLLTFSRFQPGGVAVVDYLRYPALALNTSYGSLPDGQPLTRQTFTSPTPGIPNQTVPAPVIVVEDGPAEGLFHFSWTTVPGLLYQIEFRATLAGSAWAVVAEGVAQGDVMSFEDHPPSGASQGYYRVVVRY